MRLLEVCTGNVQDALNAEAAGAQRIELCDGLDDGGKTPSFASIKIAAKKLHIPLHVMIRPRAGNFVYSNLEFLIMQHDIAMAKNSGADGFVFGILNADGLIDIERCKQLVALCQPFDVTFHRAFDLVADKKQGLEDVIATGATAILTSGGKNSAFDGLAELKELAEDAKGRINIIAGGGINDLNLALLAKHSGANAFHLSARRKNHQPDPYLTMAGVDHPQFVMDEKMVATCAQILKANDN